MNETVYSLEYAPFRAWLEAMPPGTVVGQRGRACGCPLARYLKWRGALSACVFAREYHWGGKRREYPLPVWARALVARLDQSGMPEYPTAADVLAALAECPQPDPDTWNQAWADPHTMGAYLQ